LEAWDEKFTHIDVEHFMKGQKIEDWFPIDKDIPREILDRQKDESEEEKGSDEDSSGSDVDDDGSSIPTTPPGGFSVTPPARVSIAIEGQVNGQPNYPFTGEAVKKSWYCVSASSQ
jgi:hypothetical protein